MNETAKSVVFAVVGAALVGCATAVYFASQPDRDAQFEKVGEEFFPQFTSPDDANFIEVAAFDFEKDKPKTFRVEYKDNLWRIPSHFDYPAEAKDRLVATASSVMGLRREALAGRRDTQHERFGVIDPLSEAAKEKEDEAIGIRVKLGKSDDDILADFIIGKEVEEDALEDEELRRIRGQSQRQPMHYVRVPGEAETFIATLSLDVSTKFADWIQPDLLVLEQSDLRELVIHKYTIEEKEEEIRRGNLVFIAMRPYKVDEEVNRLTSDFGNSWKLAGIDEETEELESSKISDITRSLDNLKIMGVRPRLKIDGKTVLAGDLDLNDELKVENPEALRQAIPDLQDELGEKGFVFDPVESEKQQRNVLMSESGDLTAAANDGAVYHLHFGDTFRGSESEIEIGRTAKSDENSANANDNGSENNATTAVDGDEQESRYLLVRVEFDPKFIGEPPTAPVKPAEPEKPAVPEKPMADSENPASPDKPAEPDAPSPPEEKPSECDDVQTETVEPETDPKPADGEPSAETRDELGDTENPQDTPPPADTPDTEPKEEEDPLAKYEQAMRQYRFDLEDYATAKEQYDKDLKEYEKKLEDGKRKVELLNERFGEWYYVVSAESLKNLRLGRADLVKKKEKPESADPHGLDDPDGLPERPRIELPSLDEDDMPSPPPNDKPADAPTGEP